MTNDEPGTEKLKLETVDITINQNGFPDTIAFHSGEIGYCRISFDELTLLYEKMKTHITPEPDHMDAYDHGYKNGHIQGLKDGKEQLACRLYDLKFKLPGV